MIGFTFGLLSSYVLKQQTQLNKSDNFDIIMMIVPPIVSFLIAEALSLSGLLSIMVCAFIQSNYA